MKNTFLILLFVGIAFLGCSDNFDNTVVSTPNESDNFSLPKMFSDDVENISTSTFNKDRLIQGNVDITDFKKFKISKVVDGDIGGEIILDTNYVSEDGRVINVFLKVRFPPGSFQGEKKIKITPYPYDLSIILKPQMDFDETVKLTYIITGLDLEAMGFTYDTEVDFVYFSSNGDTQEILSDEVDIDVDHQEIKVRNAKLEHFSRYGWVR